MVGRLSWLALFASACVGTGNPDGEDTDDGDDTTPAVDTDLADTDAVDTDTADTDVADTDLADTDVADTDSGLHGDTDLADTDSGVLVDTDVADTDSDTPVDTDVADTDVVDTDVADTDVIDTDPPVVDEDGDGWPTGLDCDDDDPLINPGAVQRCDGVDHTCGVTRIDPDGTVTVQHAVGGWEDLTSLFLSGTDSAPTVYASVPGDALRLCGGTWPVSITLAAHSTLVGVYGPTIAHGASRPGLYLGEGAAATGVSLDLSAVDVAAVEATGAATFTGGEIHGAKWGVFVNGTGALTLDDVWVRDTSGAAITLWPGGGASVTVLNSTLQRVGEAAIQTYGATAATLKGVHIVDAAKGLAGNGATLSLTTVTMVGVGQPFDVTGTSTGVLDDVHVDGATAVSAWYGGELTVTGSSFVHGRGWLVSPTDPVTPVRFEGCTFDALDAGASWGGALHVMGDNTVVTGSSFSNGHADAGGAIFSASHIVVSDSTFTANQAASGGAIYLSQSLAGLAEISDCTFKENSSGWGGAVYTEGAAVFERDSFVANSALGGGGGVYMSAGGADPITVSDSTFEGNEAETGGGVCATRLTTSNNVWRGNTATNGGAIYAYTPRDFLNLRGDAFYANAAAQFGGAIGWGPTLSGQSLVFGSGADANLPAEGASAGANLKLVDGDVSCSFATCVP